MNHMTISIMKSFLRMIACIILILNTNNLIWFASLFLIAEVLGVLEELFDKRKEK